MRRKFRRPKRLVMHDPNPPPPSDPYTSNPVPPSPPQPPFQPPPSAAYTPPPQPPLPPVYPAPAYVPPSVPSSAPQDYRTAGLFLLIAGITTTFSSLVVVVCTIWFCIGACWIPLAALGVLTIIVGARASSGVRSPSIRLVNAFALVASLFSCDLIGLTLNILALIWLARDDVSRWIEARN